MEINENKLGLYLSLFVGVVVAIHNIFYEKLSKLTPRMTTGYSDTSLDEVNAMMTFRVSLRGVLEDGESLTVDFQTADNTATASYDYASTQKSVSFTKDSMTQIIEVLTYDDNYKEMSGIVNNIDFNTREVA